MGEAGSGETAVEVCDVLFGTEPWFRADVGAASGAGSGFGLEGLAVEECDGALSGA